MKIDFYKHNIDQSDIDSTVAVLRSIMLTTGDVVKDFEKQFSSYLGCRYTTGLTSCTGALHLALLAYDIGPGDEVVTTPMTFIATANAILHAGALPVFVDVERTTANIDAALIEAAITPRTKAILPVHLYGQMCDMRTIKTIADKHHLKIIEDAAHAIEASRDGIRPGQAGDAACFSFYATKSITSGEGGAVITNDKDTDDRLKILRLHGMNKGAADRYSKRYQHWDMLLLGWKYNMDNIQAALLINQLKRIDGFQKRRLEICSMYEQEFKDNKYVTCLKESSGSKNARLMFTILVNPDNRDKVLWQLQDRGIGVAVNYRAIHLLTYYKQRFGFRCGDFPVAELIGDSTITLPLYPGLKDEQVNYVIEAVNDVTAKIK